MKNNEKGITLIALVITIIVLLILAGVAIATLTGENGLLIKATQSSEVTQKEKTRERIVLSADAAIIEGKGDLSYQNLNKELENEFGKDNYKILSVGKGYLIIVDNVQYKIDKSGKVEEGNEIVESTIEFAGDLSKGGKYDGTTEETAYQINCIEDLVEWSKNYGKYQSSYISLERTLDFESTDSYNDYTAITTDINGNGELEALIQELTTGSGFLPIANFTGTLDGKNNEIRNLYENRTGDGVLILSATGIKISNLGITGEIKATKNAAGLIASSNSSNIVNSYNKCNVEGVTTGGIIGNAGVNSTHIVYNCYNLGNIEATETAGGINGKNYGDGCTFKLYNCYNKGTIKSSSYVGGISGILNGSVEITNCYNLGVIIGNYPGGIAGYCKAGHINNCLNVGNIESTSTEGVKAAGLICHLWLFNEANLNQAYYLNNVEVAVARKSWSSTLNYKGNAIEKEDICTQEFVNDLNNYVDNYESDDENVILSRWKYNEGEYPTFE